jgi:hypothetical protein
VPRGLGIAVPLQSPETDSSCVRFVADAGASSPAVHLPFRVLSKVRYRRIGSTIPPWSLPLTGSTFGVFPRPPRPEDAESSCHPLVDLALLQSLTRAGPPLSPRVALNNTRCEKLPLLGFPAPPADEVSGSDLRRACITRLRCASRLSRPRDALIPPETVPALFHADYAHGVLPFRGFPSQALPAPLGTAPSSALLSTSVVLVPARFCVAPPSAARPAPRSGSDVVRECAGFSERALEGLRPTWESVLVSAGLAA